MDSKDARYKQRIFARTTNRTRCFAEATERSKTKKLWKLKNTMYGLSDANKQWYLKIKDSLERFGAMISICGKALFYYTEVGKLQGLIAFHEND